jgi:hypothetical protein
MALLLHVSEPQRREANLVPEWIELPSCMRAKELWIQAAWK